MLILQLAAIKVRIAGILPWQVKTYFPRGFPDIPVWFGETDNTVSKSWENKVTSKTSTGQGLVAVYAELLRTSRIHTQCEHVPGKDNIIADDISRNDFSLSLPARSQQLFRRHPSLAPLDYFRPSQQFLRLLSSQLFYRPSQEDFVLTQYDASAFTRRHRLYGRKTRM